MLLPSSLCWLIGFVYNLNKPNVNLEKVNFRSWLTAAALVFTSTITMNKAIYITNFPLVTLFKTCNILSVLSVAIFCSKVQVQNEKLGIQKLFVGVFVTLGVLLYQFGGNQ